MNLQEVIEKFQYLNPEDLRVYTKDEADLALRVGIMQRANPKQFEETFSKIKETFMVAVVAKRFDALGVDFCKSDIIFFSTVYPTIGGLLLVFYTGLFLSIDQGYVKHEDGRITVFNLRGGVFGGGVPTTSAIDKAWDAMKNISSSENFIDSHEVHDAIAEYMNLQNNPVNHG